MRKKEGEKEIIENKKELVLSKEKPRKAGIKHKVTETLTAKA